MRRRWKDRQQAGRWLARRLGAYAGRGDAIVLALPRGGVPLGYVIAQALALPLDLLSRICGLLERAWNGAAVPE
ncbi:hypothetical protein [Duganella vulcania]|uniref:Phosphoribosyltransferase n=1 Tax=Duganella vulcania TaxID=2692166 RepID=A0A845GUV2_9BURK|nr:hypothetical protein [Duganella vulcania]MYM97008.1 hypothetical protein [Duganella vulcania]